MKAAMLGSYDIARSVCAARAMVVLMILAAFVEQVAKPSSALFLQQARLQHRDVLPLVLVYVDARLSGRWQGHKPNTYERKPVHPKSHVK